MLLTSGQVSFAISSFVVFLFTSALFLSGYVLQQQTVRDLRAAIKPKPTPQNARLYLPTQFAARPAPSPKAEFTGEVDGMNGEVQELEENKVIVEVTKSRTETSTEDTGQNEDVAPIAPIAPGETTETKQPQKTQGPADMDHSVELQAEDQKPIGVDLGSASDRADLEIMGPNPASEEPLMAEKVLSRAERRRRIKADLMAAGDGEGFKGYKRRQW